MLSGDDEARLTFLAVRRWFGWSAGNLICLDIGGGSLELAAGADEEPARRSPSRSAPRVSPANGSAPTRRARTRSPPSLLTSRSCSRSRPTGSLRTGVPDRVVATSKTFRTLARLAGAAPSSAGSRARRVLTRTGLTQVHAFISRMASVDLAELDGVSVGRAHQVLAGSVVAAGAMDALGVDELELCPWALREGVILRRLDWLDGT